MRGPICRFCGVLLALLMLLPGIAAAQSGDDDVVVAWTEVPGIYEAAPEGEVTGYFAALARALAQEAGLRLQFREYPTIQAVIAAQAGGEATMIAGVGMLPSLKATNVFSIPVTESASYLFVRADSVDNFPEAGLKGARIGVVAGSMSSDLGKLAEDNRKIDYATPIAAFGALMMREVDGVVMSERVATDTLRRAGVDHMVRIAGPALRKDKHYVALHESRAELLPRINQAIMTLAENHVLEGLRSQWNIGTTDPVPDVLTVGVTHFPPYQVVNDDGTVTGFGVETLRDLADRAGLKLLFKVIPIEEWAEGPGSGRYDILPPISISRERRERMDFTSAVQQSPFSIFLRHGAEAPVRGLDDLAGWRVGVVEENLAREVAATHGGMELVIFQTAKEMMKGLIEGRVDAALYPTITARGLIAEMKLAEKIAEVSPPFYNAERAVALRPGLAIVREQLNAVIPGYLGSEQYQALRQSWLGAPEFWTPARVRNARIGVVLLSLAVIAAFLAQNIRARRNAEGLAAETRAVSKRLKAILDAARSGVIGLNAAGQITSANPSAREMLGEVGTEAPFPWPAGLTFIEPDRMQPVPADLTPIARAMAGEALRGETAAMKQEGKAQPSYVRVSSTPVDARAVEDVATVVILDDITEQERNRQQMERSSRLDALGQLTGGVAHDFNNILATIEYALQLVKPDTPAEAQPFLKTAETSVRRGAELTKRLLAFAKRQPGMESSVSTVEVLEEFAELGGAVIEEAITLRFENEAEDAYVYCELGQLENALLNLVINSRDAITGSGKGDRITVRVRSLSEVDSHSSLYRKDADSSQRYIEFSVSDNGPGMTEEVRRRATDPFFTTKGQNSGTGLGLSMVYGFVEQSNGEMRIYSELGHGTTVRLVLPRGTADNRREAPRKKEQVVAGNGQRILIVEDEISLLTIITEVVRSLNYEVVAATSGREALALVEAGEGFDLLLTDVVMPGGIGGFELAKEVRARRPEVPVVYMTGYSGLLEADMGAVRAPMLQKPCPPAELAAALRKALGV